MDCKSKQEPIQERENQWCIFLFYTNFSDFPSLQVDQSTSDSAVHAMQCYLAPIYWCLFQESYLTEHPLQMDSLPASDKDGLIAFWHKKTIFFSGGEEALSLPLSYCTSLSILAEVILDLMFPFLSQQTWQNAFEHCRWIIIACRCQVIQER